MQQLKNFIFWLFRSLSRAFHKASLKVKALVVVVVVFIIAPASGISLALIFISLGALLYMLRSLGKGLLDFGGRKKK